MRRTEPHTGVTTEYHLRIVLVNPLLCSYAFRPEDGPRRLAAPFRIGHFLPPRTYHIAAVAADLPAARRVALFDWLAPIAKDLYLLTVLLEKGGYTVTANECKALCDDIRISDSEEGRNFHEKRNHGGVFLMPPLAVRENY